MVTELIRPPGQQYQIEIKGFVIVPRHPPPLKPEGLFIPAINHQDFGNEGGVIGYDNEQKVGRLVSRIDFVDGVRQVEPHGRADNRQIDLAVTMTEGFPIRAVFIQVKSGYTEVATFFDLIGRQLDEKDRLVKTPKTKLTQSEEYKRRKEFMMRRGLICINAGRKKRGMVTDFYIRDKFMRDLEEMIAYRRNNP